jgi:hypothetical protein
LALYFIEITAAHVRGENCSAFPSVAGKHASQGRLAGAKRADHEREVGRVYGVANFFCLFSPDPNGGVVVSAHIGHENQYELSVGLGPTHAGAAVGKGKHSGEFEHAGLDASKGRGIPLAGTAAWGG